MEFIPLEDRDLVFDQLRRLYNQRSQEYNDKLVDGFNRITMFPQTTLVAIAPLTITELGKAIDIKALMSYRVYMISPVENNGVVDIDINAAMMLGNAYEMQEVIRAIGDSLFNYTIQLN